MTLYVLLPCYNEERNIEELISKISNVCRDFNYKIIAVDDGSKDATYPYLYAMSKNYPIILLRHKENKGLHEALRTLLLFVCDTAGNSDYIIIMDSDLTHDPKYIPQLISACKKEEADVAIASRFVEGGKQIGVPLHRAFLSKGLHLFVKFTLGIPVRDVSSGYRCIRVSKIKEIIDKYGFQKFIEAKGFEVQLELLYKLFSNGAKIVEVPFILDYSMKKGKSKIKILRTIRGYLQIVSKIHQQSNLHFPYTK